MMSLDEYKQALKTVRADLEAARQREVEVNDDLLETRGRIADLVATERSLARLCGEDSVTNLAGVNSDLAEMVGLTDAVRALLKASYPEAMTALDVRNRLAAVGFDSKRFSNLTASIHTTLKRLERTREVKKSLKNGKAAYEWNPSFKKAA